MGCLTLLDTRAGGETDHPVPRDPRTGELVNQFWGDTPEDRPNPDSYEAQVQRIGAALFSPVPDIRYTSHRGQTSWAPPGERVVERPSDTYGGSYGNSYGQSVSHPSADSSYGAQPPAYEAQPHTYEVQPPSYVEEEPLSDEGSLLTGALSALGLSHSRPQEQLAHSPYQHDDHDDSSIWPPSRSSAG
jgi:hypothetical protein